MSNFITAKASDVLKLVFENGSLESKLKLKEKIKNVEVKHFYYIFLNDSNTVFNDNHAKLAGSYHLYIDADVTEEFRISQHSLEIKGEISLLIDTDSDKNSEPYPILEYWLDPEVWGGELLSVDESCFYCDIKGDLLSLYPNKLICRDCATFEEFFICPSCGVVYHFGEYNGDGVLCQLCK